MLSLLCGCAILYSQTVSNTTQEALTLLRHAQQNIDRIFDRAHEVVFSIKKTLGRPCNEIVALLRVEVAVSPYVRSISLVHGNNIYCTSLHGPFHEETTFENYTKGQLLLMKGNWLKVDQPIVVYREIFGNDSITVRLYGQQLLSELEKIDTRVNLTLVVGPQRWRASHPPTDELFPLETPGYLEQKSSRYPFRIVTLISHADYIANIWRYSKFSLFAWSLLSLLAGIWIFRTSGRENSPLGEMQRALTQKEFIPYIQPVVSGEHMHITGCEVLMRWFHPRQGLISPDLFIPLAEQSGLIIPMTRNLMDQVRKNFAQYQHQLPINFHFGFNISASHFKELSLVDDCRNFLLAFRDSPVILVLELTERELLVIDGVTAGVITDLHKLGVLIAIDDFGTGNSSLSYLQKFQVDILKIDRSFVSMVGSDALSSHIIDNIIDLARRLKLKTVAEGVETEAQSAYLRENSITFMQGYLYGRPSPINEFFLKLSESDRKEY